MSIPVPNREVRLFQTLRLKKIKILLNIFPIRRILTIQKGDKKWKNLLMQSNKNQRENA